MFTWLFSIFLVITCLFVESLPSKANRHCSGHDVDLGDPELMAIYKGIPYDYSYEDKGDKLMISTSANIKSQPCLSYYTKKGKLNYTCGLAESNDTEVINISPGVVTGYGLSVVRANCKKGEMEVNIASRKSRHEESILCKPLETEHN